MSDFSSTPWESTPEQRFRGLWHQDLRPDVDRFLAEIGPLSLRDLAAVLRVDQQERWRRGEGVAAEEYLTRYPQVGNDPEAALELVYAEFLLRRERGESPSADDYLRRFPQLGARLRQQFHLHNALAETPSPPPGRVSSVLPPGTVLGQYVVLEVLGQGGMGHVYKARHQVMNRVVALKVIRAEVLEHPHARDRFRREIEAVARLAHPHIVTAHDAAEVDGIHFLVMEYIAGTNLDRLVQERGPLPVGAACEYMRQAALGLHHAFERGLIHRDIKPSNLMVTPEGRVKVLDMGLAVLVHDADRLTPPGAVVGTPDFMAPEQARDAQAADVRADVYSLGCTLYFLLTGQPPFPDGGMATKLLKHLVDDPVPVAQLRPLIPAKLSVLVRQMMAKRPDQRPATPADVAAALAPFAAVDTASWPSSPRSTPPRHGRRMLLTVAGLLVAVAAATVVFFNRPPTSSSGGTGPEPTAPTPGPAEAFQLRADLMSRPFGREPIQRTNPRCLAFSPDGQTLALGDDDGQVRLWDVNSPRERPLKGHASAVLAVAFARDGKLLASAAEDGTREGIVILWDVPGGAKRCSLKLADALPPPQGPQPGQLRPAKLRGTYVFPTAFSPTGDLLAVGGADRLTGLWDVTREKPLGYCSTTVPDDGQERPVYAVAFSPDGQRLATGDADHLVRVWDVGTRQEISFPRKDVAPVQAVAWSPDGKTLAFGGSGGTVKVWTVGDKEERATLAGHGAAIIAVAFSPDGRVLASLDHKGKVRLWDAERAKELASLSAASDRATGLAFSPDGTALAVTSFYCVTAWELTRVPQAP